jgi:3-isopropylmalate/(R)-2-methylmalate dehydratase small subunit
MEKIIGKVAPLDKSNVDTDQIIPKQFLTSIKRTGFGEFLFDAWRYLDEGYLGQDCSKREINPDFILNKPVYQGANILLAGTNFGCGSSREHAPWALKEYGFEAIIAPSFADIFYNNCFNNHILAIVLDTTQIKHLFELSVSAGSLNLSIDLLTQTISAPSINYSFELDSFRKTCLIKNLDDIAVTLTHSNEIKQYEQQRKQITPWMFTDV